MKGTLGRVGGAVAFGLALFVPCTFGQVEIRFNGSTASPALLEPGDLLAFEVFGPGPTPFAALVSPAPAFVDTPYGILFADPMHEQAVIVFDGFDPFHPTYATAVIPDGSPFHQDFIPFQAGGAYADGYYVQAIVADPGSPAGLVLTNHIVLRYDPPPPQVTAVFPNIVSPPMEMTVAGLDFSPDPLLNTVRLNAVTCPVVAATRTELTIVVPVGARSGPIEVETPDGISAAVPDVVATWLAVVHASFQTEAVAPGIVTDGATILGDLATNEEQNYVVHLDAGEQLVAELYAFDPTTFRITGYVNAVTPYFDPFLRIRRNPAVPVTVLLDDDSGPSMTAAVGLAAGSPLYVASESEDVVVQVSAQNGLSYGAFLLALAARPPSPLPVTVQAVGPGTARVGDLVTIQGTGFDPAQPGAHAVLMVGATVPALAVGPANVQFLVPDGAVSGPVRVQAPAGTSPYDADRYQCWLCVHGYTEVLEVENVAPTVSPGTLVRGQISPGSDVDDVLIALAAGQSIVIECHPWDPGAGNITGGSVLAPAPLDPEIRIMNDAATLTYVVDQNSGPGLGAGFGVGPTSAPFTAPVAATYRIRVLAFFGWSTGQYVLAINPLP